MLYQIKVSEQYGKLRPRGSGPVIRDASKKVILRPCVNIESIAFWQKRAAELLPDCHITCQVAK